MFSFRRLLLCLMMLALPLQGFAAASMLYCGMGTGHGAKFAQTEIGSNHHKMTDAPDVKHDHAMHVTVAKVAKQSANDQKKLPDSTHKCGVCAACCRGKWFFGVLMWIRSPTLTASCMAMEPPRDAGSRNTAIR